MSRGAGVRGALRIGTRGSRLALAQAHIVVDALRSARVADAVDVVPIRTHGDEVSELRPRGGWEDADGQFTNELESALLRGSIDLAVHSHKDLPTAPRPGVVIAAVPERADARDCIVTRGGGLDELGPNARIGTSSVRRAAQLRALRTDLAMEPIRGNIDTRLRRLAEGEYDALILAAAGLERLGVSAALIQPLEFDVMLPAPAQGALAVQARADDAALLDPLAALDHQATRTAVDAERELLRAIGGGCLAPLGAYAEVTSGSVRLRAAYAPDGDAAAGSLRRADVVGPVSAAGEVVAAVAAVLVSRGRADVVVA